MNIEDMEEKNLALQEEIQVLKAREEYRNRAAPSRFIDIPSVLSRGNVWIRKSQIAAIAFYEGGIAEVCLDSGKFYRVSEDAIRKAMGDCVVKSQPQPPPEVV